MLITLGAFSFEHGVAVASCSSAALVAALMLVCAYRPLGHFLLRLADKLPLVKRISPKLHEAYDALVEMTRPMPLLVGSLLAFLAWGLECCSLYVILFTASPACIWRGTRPCSPTRPPRWRVRSR